MSLYALFSESNLEPLETSVTEGSLVEFQFQAKELLSAMDKAFLLEDFINHVDTVSATERVFFNAIQADIKKTLDLNESLGVSIESIGESKAVALEGLKEIMGKIWDKIIKLVKFIGKIVFTPFKWLKNDLTGGPRPSMVSKVYVKLNKEDLFFDGKPLTNLKDIHDSWNQCEINRGEFTLEFKKIIDLLDPLVTTRVADMDESQLSKLFDTIKSSFNKLDTKKDIVCVGFGNKQVVITHDAENLKTMGSNPLKTIFDKMKWLSDMLHVWKVELRPVVKPATGELEITGEALWDLRKTNWLDSDTTTKNLKALQKDLSEISNFATSAKKLKVDSLSGMTKAVIRVQGQMWVPISRIGSFMAFQNILVAKKVGVARAINLGFDKYNIDVK